MAQRRRNFFELLGLSGLPWATRVYLVLVFTFTGLALLSATPFFAQSMGLAMNA